MLNITNINFDYLSNEQKELFYKLHLHKHPYVGIYRKNWNLFFTQISSS